MAQKIEFQDLRQMDGTDIRVHGNGFIQLDIGEKRLHVWPEKKLLTQKVYTGIHNHKFSLESEILIGCLKHIQYTVSENNIDGEYQLYNAVPREGQDTEMVLFNAGKKYDFINPQTFEMQKGSKYDFPHSLFHESIGIGLTATLLTKTLSLKHLPALIACKVGKNPDNEFNRYQIDSELLWVLVEEVFNVIKYITI
jgi:hypothetical protein